MTTSNFLSMNHSHNADSPSKIITIFIKMEHLINDSDKLAYITKALEHPDKLNVIIDNVCPAKKEPSPFK